MIHVIEKNSFYNLDLGFFGTDRSTRRFTHFANFPETDIRLVYKKNIKNKKDYLTIYGIENDNKIVFELYLKESKPLHNRKTYYVDLMLIDDIYKGFDIAPKLYSFLLREYGGWVLRSGVSQTFGGVSVWNRLCLEQGIQVYASNGNHFEPCEYDESGELFCDVDVYDSEDKYNSYHLYAIASR